MRQAILSIVAVITFATTALAADQPNPAEAKLREGLKNTMLQLRTVQGEKAALDSAKAELEAKVAELSEKADQLEKQAADDKMAADKRIAEQTESLVEKGNSIIKMETDLAKSQKAYSDASALAARRETERAKLLSEKVVLDRKVADQQTRNLAMYELGMEVLTRLQKFGLGTAIAAREPFVGLTRIKFQNLVQDYGDKLADHKIKP